MTIEGRGARVGLGQIAHMDPREVWRNEALDFTPWLRANQALLGEALRLDLEINDAEVPVGGFNVDLVGNDLTNHRRLIVENQLEQTDHTHLGQLLTYAAGVDAATIVWISPQFREEHRQALDWLNAHTDDQVDVFGLELEVIRIGDSAPAPNLRPVATPNEWASGARRAASGAEPSSLSLSRQRFFQAALNLMKTRQPGLTNASNPGPQNWFSMSAGRTHFSFNWVLTGNRRMRVELYIDTPDAEVNRGFLAALAERRETIEAALSSPLEWNVREGRRAVRVSLDRPLGDRPPDQDADLVEWAVTTMLDFNRVLRPIVRGLQPALPATSEEETVVSDPANDSLD